MPGHYEATIVNASPLATGIVLYQSLPEGPGSLQPLAWFTGWSMPGTRMTFAWQSNLGFVCAATAPLTPGAVFEPVETLDCDPGGNNQVTLGYDRGLRFSEHNGRSPIGRLQIVQDAGLPPGAGAVGLAVAGRPALVQPVEPGRVLTILPRPDYWIGLGTYVPGEVLDVVAAWSGARLPLEPGGGTLTAVLTMDMVWSFTSGR